MSRRAYFAEYYQRNKERKKQMRKAHNAEYLARQRAYTAANALAIKLGREMGIPMHYARDLAKRM